MRVCLSIIAVAALALAALGAETWNGRSRLLHDPDSAKVNANAGRILADRKGWVDEAIEILEESDPPPVIEGDEARLSAITILGVFRAPEGVNALIKAIDSRRTTIVRTALRNRQITPDEEYPAVEALIEIGRPAVDGCIRDLMGDRPEGHRARVVWVLGVAEGREGGRTLLEREIRRRKDDFDPAIRQRLEAALVVFDKQFPPEKGEP